MLRCHWFDIKLNANSVVSSFTKCASLGCHRPRTPVSLPGVADVLVEWESPY